MPDTYRYLKTMLNVLAADAPTALWTRPQLNVTPRATALCSGSHARPPLDVGQPCIRHGTLSCYRAGHDLVDIEAGYTVLLAGWAAE